MTLDLRPGLRALHPSHQPVRGVLHSLGEAHQLLGSHRGMRPIRRALEQAHTDRGLKGVDPARRGRDVHPQFLCRSLQRTHAKQHQQHAKVIPTQVFDGLHLRKAYSLGSPFSTYPANPMLTA